MEFPIKVALAQAVPTLPEGPGMWFEPKFDGHRVVLRRTDDTVILYARSGRAVTPYWMDLALAGMALRNMIEALDVGVPLREVYEQLRHVQT
ncbi:hypothetical protein OHA88_03395 [Streptomyces sp. NBC_00353]|uniref:hypothetical protein n=1 Tax=Streptomyces sp. NBC_00353 TaxID=2975722 RepID=UPI002E254877